MNHGQWMLNGEFGERWSACEYFDTKKEAIDYGVTLLKGYNSANPDDRFHVNLDDGMNINPNDNDYGNIYVFYVGQLNVVGFPDKVDCLLETISDTVYDEVGEYAEGYLSDVTEEHKTELADLIQDWAKRHDYLPTCFTIGQTEEIDIRVVSEVAE